MLNLYFGSRDETIYNTSRYFNNVYEDDWFDDPLVREMIKDIDQSDVVGPNLIQSQILGPIPPVTLSGGVKTLILLLKKPEKCYNLNNCGDNCEKWIKAISEIHDINADLQYLLSFDTDFEIKVLNRNKVITTFREFVDEYVRWKADCNAKINSEKQSN